MRLSSTPGIRFRSKLSPVLVGTARRPSISVSVRVPKKPFRPRRSATYAPVKKLEPPVLCGVNMEVLAGVISRTCPTLTTPRFSRVVASMTVVGVGVVKSVVRLMRVPVTVTSCSCQPSLSAAAVGASCAAAFADQVTAAIRPQSMAAEEAATVRRAEITRTPPDFRTPFGQAANRPLRRHHLQSEQNTELYRGYLHEPGIVVSRPRGKS